jgi:hypothetical protein
MPQEGPPVLGHSHHPRDPSSGGSGLCRPIFGPNLQFNHPKAISMQWKNTFMRWADLQINSIMPGKDQWYWATPCPRDPNGGGSGRN